MSNKFTFSLDFLLNRAQLAGKKRQFHLILAPQREVEWPNI